MKTILDDGRIFETKPFLNIEFKADEPVYKYVYTTEDRIVKSSARHTWAVWNKKNKQFVMVRMDKIDINNHELLVQGRVENK